MSLADDLLELAKKSVNYNKPDLLDARVRRAISTAYYALFHLLTEQAAAKLSSHPGIRILVGRAYAHGDMYKTAKTFKSGGLPTVMKAPFAGVFPPLPEELVRVASAFVALQDERHRADYDPLHEFSRATARGLVAQAVRAFADWKAFDADPANADLRDLFLAALLIGERWKR